MAELRCEQVAKSYGARTVLCEVDLTVAAGTLTAILGASGSGKTTLLRTVMGFVDPDRGVVRIGSSTLVDDAGTRVPAEQRAIGYVAQEGALFPHLSVGENVGFGLARPERRSGARIAEALTLVGLDAGYASRQVHQLSGGEQRRVGLARALAPRPRVVLLDEPFSGLDAGLRVETREAVLHALAEEGTTAVLVTHDQAEAMSMGREVAVLQAGRVVQCAAPTVVYRTPADLEVARFVGEAVVLDGKCRSRRVSCALGELDVRGPAISGAVRAVIRPEQIRIARGVSALAGGSGERAKGSPVGGKVLGHTFQGPDTIIRVKLNGRPEVVVVRTFDEMAPAPGDDVELVVHGPVVVFAADEDPR